MRDTSYTNDLLEKFFKTFYHLEKQFFQLTYPDLTITEFHTLEAISELELTMFQLASKLSITMGTATIAVNKLFKKNFIHRKKDIHDKRKVLVSLTKQGKNALNFHLNFHENIFAAIVEPISESDLKQFQLTMLKILGGLKEMSHAFESITLANATVGLRYIISDCPEEISVLTTQTTLKVLEKNSEEMSLLVDHIKITLPILLAEKVCVVQEFIKETLCST